MRNTIPLFCSTQYNSEPHYSARKPEKFCSYLASKTFGLFLAIAAALIFLSSALGMARADMAFDRVVVEPIALDASIMLGTDPVPPLEAEQLRDPMRASLLRAFKDFAMSEKGGPGALWVRTRFTRLRFMPAAEGGFSLIELGLSATLHDGADGQKLFQLKEKLAPSETPLTPRESMQRAEQIFERWAWLLRHEADRINKIRGSKQPQSPMAAPIMSQPKR